MRHSSYGLPRRQITISLRRDLYRKLEELSWARDVSKSRLIEELIEQAQRESNPPR